MECKKELVYAILHLKPQKEELQCVLDEDVPELGQLFVEDWHDLVGLYFSDSDIEGIQRCKMLLDLTWEKLNTGCWKDVSLSWRRVYTSASILKIFSSVHSASEQDCWKGILRDCDMALLMGSPLMDGLLTEVASLVQAFLWEKCSKADDNEEVFCKKRKISASSFCYPGEKISEIVRIDCPTIEEFMKVMRLEEPVVLTNCIDHWPAMSTRRWTLSYLRSVAGYRTVPVEIGSSYAEENWSQQLMTISDFINKFMHTKEETSAAPVGYLAQHQLFSQIPELRNDILTPDYCCISDSASPEVDINAWFGPRGTVSPMHHDMKHNLLAQVNGEKFVKLYSPKQTEFLYPHKGSFLFNTSQLNAENPDLVKFPLFSQASGIHLILRSGELLYIPPKYWHYVRSLSPSFSVNFWWE